MTSMRPQGKYNLRTECPCLGFSFNGHTIVDTLVTKGSCDVFQRIVFVILTVTTLGFSWTVVAVICSSVLIRSLTSLFGRIF